MIDWIRGKISGAISRIEDLANSVIDGFRAVWNVFASLMHVLRVVFGDMASGVVNFLKHAIEFANWVAGYLRNVVVNIIPRAIAYVSGEIRAWVSQAIWFIRNLFSAALDQLRRWAESAINYVTDLLIRVRDWLWGYVKNVVNWVVNIGNRLADIVLHPDKLATWVVPALWGPLWRYVQAQAVPIGRWILARSVGAVLGSAGLIESVIVKIF